MLSETKSDFRRQSYAPKTAKKSGPGNVGFSNFSTPFRWIIPVLKAAFDASRRQLSNAAFKTELPIVITELPNLKCSKRFYTALNGGLSHFTTLSKWIFPNPTPDSSSRNFSANLRTFRTPLLGREVGEPSKSVPEITV